MNEKKEPYCNRCGACCKAFVVDISGYDSFEEMREEAHGSPAWKDSILLGNGDSWFDFVELISEEEAEAEGVLTLDAGSRGDTKVFGKCSLYEESEGVGFCTRHEERPYICRAYRPKVQGEEGYLHSSKYLHPKCSYREYFAQVAEKKEGTQK